MTLEKLPLEHTNAFSQFFLDYVSRKDTLQPFYNLAPKPENFKAQIENKKFTSEKRDVLFHALTDQYSGLEISQSVKSNIESLKSENTFTITTGHQLNIFTGPLYFIYKIVTVVNACKELKLRYPNFNFIPVYWMASEDHDFDEIKYFNLFGKKHVWETEQKGAVGRFKTDELKALIDQLPEKVELFEKAYLEHDSLVSAARYYVNELFSDEGVVVIDGDDKNLKQQFSKTIEDDIFNHHANDLVEETSGKLSALGYKPQVYPRAINFFYLKGSIRERLVKEQNGWKVNNTELIFSENEIKNLLKNEPEVFSPNVIMRPLYQETILPNLAYVGGPGELVYWLQLKSTFDYYKLSFPILLPRNFAHVINKASRKKVDKFEFTITDLFSKPKVLKEKYLQEHSDNQINLNQEKENLKSVFDKITQQGKNIDGSLTGFIGSEYAKALKGVENIEKRLKKSEESKHEVALNQISGLKEKLFPGGGLQERHDNFLTFYLNNLNFINQLIESFEPFDFKMNVITEE